jgi:hypothetical protein
MQLLVRAKLLLASCVPSSQLHVFVKVCSEPMTVTVTEVSGLQPPAAATAAVPQDGVNTYDHVRGTPPPAPSVRAAPKLCPEAYVAMCKDRQRLLAVFKTWGMQGHCDILQGTNTSCIYLYRVSKKMYTHYNTEYSPCLYTSFWDTLIIDKLVIIF